MTRSNLLASFLFVALSSSPLVAATFEVEKSEQGVTVKVDGALFTKYVIKSGAKPIFYPVIGPTGAAMTRSYPIEAGAATERKDHVHHRSFWFTHGDVNGVDFWGEAPGHGEIVHRKFTKIKGGEKAVIASINDWIGPKGEKICEDQRVFTFGADDDARWIDCDITVRATNGKVTFGDTKEGSFGVRVAGTMKVTADQGGKIVNNRGQTNQTAWGQRAEWVDYHGPVGKEVVGVAIFNHPSSLRHPTNWHVRTYGLFTANPFGLHHFYNDKTKDGSLTLSPGESFKLRHRVLFHKGDESEGKVASRYAEYAKTK